MGGVASAIGTGLNNYDAPGFVSGMFFGVRANTVGQTFSRKFSAIDYKIQKQQLHREDIRDLVELTTARMDIFHIVGTLLLAFCMEWYTDNSILAGNLPMWFADIFLISNFAAVGYLMLCVWLAMYAAIAARSIGVRLLTSYARLAFPDKEELDDIKVPIFVNSREYIKKKMRDMSRSSQDTPPADGEEVVIEGSEKLQAPDPKEELSEDDQQHFRRILQEMPKWLIYDIWSRVCMTMGINQMLQALSYYILGILWAKSSVIAIMSFVGINYLSYVMLWLDLGDNIYSFGDIMGVIFLNLLPPTLAAALLGWDTLLHNDIIDVDETVRLMLSMLATLCFWAHGAWLTYLMLQFRSAGQMGNKYKPGSYAQVLEWVDFHPVQSNVFEGLVKKTNALEEKIEEAMKAEDQRVIIDPRERTKLEPTYAAAERSLKVFDDYRPISHKFKRQPPLTPLAHAAKQYAGHVCTLYKVWAGAAEMAIVLQALSHELVQERLSAEQKEALKQMRVAFLNHCSSLEMGICSGGGDIKLVELDQAPIVHFEADGPHPAEWIDTAGAGARMSKEPWGTHRVVEYPMVMSDMANWETLARSLYISRKTLAPAKATIATVPPPADPEAGIKEVQEWNGGHEPGVWQKSVETPRPMEQADWLPQRVFNWFTRVAVAWWVLAGLFHAVGVLFESTGFADNFDFLTPTDSEAPTEESFLQMNWPAPSRLFKVSALHCSGGQMWVSSRYSLYRTPHDLDTKPTGLEELGGHDGVGAVLCQDGSNIHCHILRHSSPKSPWTMAFLGQSGDGTGQELPLPASWRVISGAWDPASCASPSNFSSPCGKAFLAGWDGAAISAATLSWNTVEKSWDLLRRFDLDPYVGICGAHDGTSLAFWSLGVLRGHGCSPGHMKMVSDAYSDVKALQMGASGSHLTVLLGNGAMDVWDLSTGSVIQRVRLKGKYTSMCHGQGNVYLAQVGADGPGLASMALPRALVRMPDGPRTPRPTAEHDGGTRPLLGTVDGMRKRRPSPPSVLAAREDDDR